MRYRFTPHAPGSLRDRSRHASLILVSALSFIGGGGELLAQLPAIGLRSLSQSFFAPGETYEVSIAEGANTEEARELLLSHPGMAAELMTAPPRPVAGDETPRYGNFRVTIAANVPEGRYEARAVGRFGVSNPRSVVVQNAIQILPKAGTDASTAPVIETGTIYSHRVSSQQRDFYSFAAVSGKQYTLRLITQAIDSQ